MTSPHLSIVRATEKPPRSIEQMLRDSDEAALNATDEQLGEDEAKHETFRIAYAADRMLAANVPEIDDKLRWAIAEEIAKHYRPPENVIEAVRRWLPDTGEGGWTNRLKKNAKNELIGHAINGYTLLKYHPKLRGSIRFNLYSKMIEVHGGALAAEAPTRRLAAMITAMRDVDAIVTAAQDWIYREHDCKIPHQDLGRRLVAVAMENAFDPIQNYLRALEWDGVPRLHDWLSVYTAATEEEPGYVEEVSMRWMLAAVARAMEPGSKTDLVLIFEGNQGLQKSSAFEVLGGPFYADAAIALGDKDSKMLASSAWIVELPEMASFKRSQQNALKAFFSGRDDTFRPPYGHSIVRVPRRAIFVSTTNDDEYLNDPTGNRRYLPVYCTSINLAQLLADRDMLWAEAFALYIESESCGACARSTDTVWGQRARCARHRWWLSKEMEAVAARVCRRREREPIEMDAVQVWFASVPPEKRLANFTRHDVIAGLGWSTEHISHSKVTKLGQAMVRAGFRKNRDKTYCTTSTKLLGLPYTPLKR
jgi:hypothetical protein